MPSPRKTPTASMKRQRAAELKAALVQKIESRYEALNNVNRHSPSYQTGGNEDKVLPIYQRMLSIDEGRHLAENDLSVGSMLSDIRNFSVGSVGGKPVFVTPDAAWNRAVTKLMRRWMKNCDARIPDLDFSTWLGIAVETAFRDGDFGMLLDNDLSGGQLLAFEAEQIASIDAGEWRTQAVKRGYFQYRTDINGRKYKAPLVQESGVVRNDLGRVMYVVFSGRRRQTAVSWKDATIVPVSVARVVFQPHRFGQVRGNSVLLTMIQTLTDLRRLIEAEIQSAERLARDALAVKQKGRRQALDAVLNLSAEQLLDGVDDTEAAATLATATAAPRQYKTLEDTYGGRVAYIDADDELKELTNPRPNKGIADFDQYVKQSVGKSIGFYKMFSLGQVSTSYSAARAEILLTWVMIQCVQKFLERRVVDFVVTQKINEWVETGELEQIPNDSDGAAMLPSETCTVSWPDMPQIDPLADIEAALARIKGGLSNFDIEMGPDRAAIWKRLAENVAELKLAGLDIISMFETRAGAAAGKTTTTPADKNKKNEE